MDLLLWCGPVLVKSAFRDIDWYGRQVRIVPVECTGSSNCAALAYQYRDPDGSILPRLVPAYARAPLESFEKIALASFSAGWGILTTVGKSAADRARLSAMCLSDSCFSGGDLNTGQGGVHSGYVQVALDAIRGRLLMVATTAHTSPGSHLTGRQSWKLVWDAALAESGKRAHRVRARAPLPPPSGGMWRAGSSLYWGDYTAPSSPPNQGNDLTHGQHHDLAPALWQAYLAPYLAGRLGLPWLDLLLGALAGGAGGFAAHELRGRS